MTTLIARRLASKSNLLLNPMFHSPIHKFPHPSNLPHQLSKLLHTSVNPSLLALFQRSATSTTLQLHLRHISTSSPPTEPKNPQSQPEVDNPSGHPAPPPHKHQEIEGPTVDRDLSPLANETREVTARMMKTMYSISNALAAMGLVQLGIGAWIAYAARDSPTVMTEATMISVVGFGFPFSMAFAIRQSLKSMNFFRKMEELGRLQILTSTMQVAKHLNFFFVRMRSVVYLCVAGLSVGTVYLVILR